MGTMGKVKGMLKPRFLSSNSIYFGILLTVIGGFLDAYAFITRGGVFANVQTGNFVLFGVELMEGEIHAAMLHIPPVIAFMIGVLAAENLKHRKELRAVGISGRIIIVAELALFTIVGLFPSAVSNTVVTIIISFAASLQYSYFRKISNYAYSNTMVTGDLFTATRSIYYAINQRDKEATTQFFKFMIIIAAFVVGVLIAANLVKQFGNHAIWFVTFLLFIMAIIYKPSSQGYKF
jgi:Predicted membrane protein